ncbi:MAG: phospholipid N-methyltransferase [Cognaticolwellia sp.]|jgi:phospholipid N-methyltransferase
MTRLNFFVEGIRNIKTTGTITRSSRFVCRKLIEGIDFDSAKCIVELGGGDGVVTKHILKNMKSDTKLITFEVLPKFCDLLRGFNDDRLIVAEDSAENIQKWLNDNGFEKADYVVSTLPFVNIPEDVGTRILNAAKDNLKTDGIFSQLNYTLLTRDLYQSIFGNVDFDFIMRNIPPAFILKCIKN